MTIGAQVRGRLRDYPNSWGAPPARPFRSASARAPPPPRDFCPSIDSEAAATRSSTRPRTPSCWLSEGRWGRFWRSTGTDPTSPAARARPIALVTSGTTPPSPIRGSITLAGNFSSGSRGAASVEYLLARGERQLRHERRQRHARSSAPFRASRPRRRRVRAQTRAKTASSTSSAPRATTPSLPRTPPTSPSSTGDLAAPGSSWQCRPSPSSSRPSRPPRPPPSRATSSPFSTSRCSATRSLRAGDIGKRAATRARW